MEMQSLLLETPFGLMEYAVKGSGIPVLVSHGAAGGFDQALLIAGSLLGEGFQLITPSRDGYLQSSLPSHPSPALQAHKFACLLDHLSIEKCAVLAVSVGGLSAIKFALKHPSRCTALVLISAIVKAVRPAYVGSFPDKFVFSMLNHRIYYSFRTRIADAVLLCLFGIHRRQYRALGDSDPRAAQTLDNIMQAVRDPEDNRLPGILADVNAALHFPDCAFANVTIPILAVHGSTDPFAPAFAIKQFIADVPGSRYVEIKGAGHLGVVTHRLQMMATVVPFLRTHAG